MTEDIVRQISAAKNEPEWMLDFRLKAYELYRKLPMPDFGPDLSPLDFEHINYFRRDSDRVARDWDDVPEEIKKTFDRLGVPEAERKYLAGSSAQYEPKWSITICARILITWGSSLWILIQRSKNIPN